MHNIINNKNYYHIIFDTLIIIFNVQFEQDLLWSHVCSLYHKNRPLTEFPSLAMVHKLRFEHIHLTSFSKMRVDLAAQVRAEYNNNYFVAN